MKLPEWAKTKTGNGHGYAGRDGYGGGYYGINFGGGSGGGVCSIQPAIGRCNGSGYGYLDEKDIV